MNILFSVLISLALVSPGKQEFSVDKKVSKLEWVGKKVTGQHEGTINVESGTIQVSDGKITGGMLSIDMNSIIITDLEDPETNAKLKGHLESDDFFGIKNHPKASLKINEVKHIEGKKHEIIADLTIKGKTEKVVIPANIIMEDNKVVAIGEVAIDRTKFGIKYGSGQFFEDLGDRMIDDEFIVKFKVGAKS